MLPQSHAYGISGKRILKGGVKQLMEKSKMPSSLGKISFPIGSELVLRDSEPRDSDSELVNKIFQSSLSVVFKK